MLKEKIRHQQKFITWSKLYCRWDEAMWLKLGNYYFYELWICIKPVIITSIIKGIDQKKNNKFFKKCSWFNFNNVGLTLGRAFKFYTSVTKGLKLNHKLLGANSFVSRSYRGETGMSTFCTTFVILNKVNKEIY